METQYFKGKRKGIALLLLLLLLLLVLVAMPIAAKAAVPENKVNGKYARCVRGEQTQLSFSDNGNETITDNGTILMWQKEDDGITRTWEPAISYCEGLTLGGNSDWRLPNIKELVSIVDETTYDPAINTTYFPNTKNYYSSSTTFAKDTDYMWSVGFFSGDVQYGGKGGAYVRRVRGGQ